jgi:hypothetical protein
VSEQQDATILAWCKNPAMITPLHQAIVLLELVFTDAEWGTEALENWAKRHPDVSMSEIYGLPPK